MGAGISRKQMNARVYNRLKSLQSKLQRMGVTSVYRRYQLFAETTGLTHLNGFNVKYAWSHASNGEAAGMARILIQQDGQSELYGWQQKDGEYEQGVKRIVELFSRLAPEAR